MGFKKDLWLGYFKLEVSLFSSSEQLGLFFQVFQFLKPIAEHFATLELQLCVS